MALHHFVHPGAGQSMTQPIASDRLPAGGQDVAFYDVTGTFISFPFGDVWYHPGTGKITFAQSLADGIYCYVISGYVFPEHAGKEFNLHIQNITVTTLQQAPQE